MASGSSAPSTSAAAALMAAEGKPQSPGAAAVFKAFRKIIRDPDSLTRAAEYLYESLLDDATLGIFLEVHRLDRGGILDAVDGTSDDDGDHPMVDMPNYDVFGVSTAKKPMDCTCPNCERSVAASRFAPHLEKCMGMGRVSSRIASRRLATKESSASSSSTSTYLQSGGGDDDDDQDDVDWSMEKRRKKTGQHSRSSSKK